MSGKILAMFNLQIKNTSLFGLPKGMVWKLKFLQLVHLVKCFYCNLSYTLLASDFIDYTSIMSVKDQVNLLRSTGFLILILKFSTGPGILSTNHC